MCGIYLTVSDEKIAPTNHSNLKARGPDSTQTMVVSDQPGEFIFAAFYRLAIVGLSDGMQPFVSDNTVLLCNGEIYNHRELENKYGFKPKTHSDCEVILHLYERFGIERTVQLIGDEFAFIIFDKKRRLIHFARDRLGRKPLFYSTKCTDCKLGENSHMMCTASSGIVSIEIGSIVRSLEAHTDRPSNVMQVIPGYVYTYDLEHQSMTTMCYFMYMYNPKESITHVDIYTKLVLAVRKRVVQSDRPVGFLLSGGFDSSLILSIALFERMLSKPPEVFTIGFDENAPDIKSAESMVKFLREKLGPDCIRWHKVILPISDGLEALPSVISELETYDTTTIRASTPMYLISKYISEKTDVKVVLSGEGSDELFGGYLYFKYAPNDIAFRSEIIDLLHGLYMFDVLRADRTTAAWGLEIRAPFLDDEFVSTVLSSCDLKRSDENTKQLIRNTLVTVSASVLPPDIHFGKKEAFSDAVGYSWKDTLAVFAAEEMSAAAEVNFAHMDFSPHIYPTTDEARYFQDLFYTIFGPAWHLLARLWLPNQAWVKTGSEPSARALSVYNAKA